MFVISIGALPGQMWNSNLPVQACGRCLCFLPQLLHAMASVCFEIPSWNLGQYHPLGVKGKKTINFFKLSNMYIYIEGEENWGVCEWHEWTLHTQHQHNLLQLSLLCRDVKLLGMKTQLLGPNQITKNKSYSGGWWYSDK